MKQPESRVILIAAGLLGLGIVGGVLLEKPSFPAMSRPFTVSASSKQFVVEFRVYGWDAEEHPPGLHGNHLDGTAMLDVDGERLGEIGKHEGPIRRFLYEGNHRARLIYPRAHNNGETHVVDFAVARPSLFYLTQEPGEDDEGTCVSKNPCFRKIAFELSAYEPDDPKVRVYPREEGR